MLEIARNNSLKTVLRNLRAEGTVSAGLTRRAHDCFLNILQDGML